MLGLPPSQASHQWRWKCNRGAPVAPGRQAAGELDNFPTHQCTRASVGPPWLADSIWSGHPRRRRGGLRGHGNDKLGALPMACRGHGRVGACNWQQSAGQGVRGRLAWARGGGCGKMDMFPISQGSHTHWKSAAAAHRASHKRASWRCNQKITILQSVRAFATTTTTTLSIVRLFRTLSLSLHMVSHEHNWFSPFMLICLSPLLVCVSWRNSAFS